MFTLTSNKLVRRSVQLSVAAVALASMSLSAQADEISLTKTLTTLEQNMSQASQEIVSNVKHELMLSLQMQIAEQVYDINSSIEQMTFTLPNTRETAIAVQTVEIK